MKGLPLVKALLNDPERLFWLDEQRCLHQNSQLDFIDEVTPFFKECLDNLPVEPRRIVMLFARHPELPFKAIVAFSRRPGNIVATHLERLKGAGIISKKENGDWHLANNDLHHYLVARFSGFNHWYKKMGKDQIGDNVIDYYISVLQLEAETSSELAEFRSRSNRYSRR